MDNLSSGNCKAKMLVNDLPRVVAAAADRGISADDVPGMKGVARSLISGDNASKKANQTSFEDRLLALKAHMKTHGGHFPTDKKTPLGNRVKSQRKLKRKLDRGEPTKSMCFERVSKLNELGNFFQQ
jgi:hypothetical protein